MSASVCTAESEWMTIVAGPRPARCASVASPRTVAVTSSEARRALAQPWPKARSWFVISGPSKIFSSLSSRVHLRSPSRTARPDSPGSSTVRRSSSSVRLKERACCLPVATSMWKAIVAATLPGSAMPGRSPRVGMMRAMPPQRPDAVVFDNDGLLLDTESVWTRAEEDLFERHRTEFTADHKRELIGKSGAMASELLEGWLDLPGQGAALMEELDRDVVAELEHGGEAMVGARDLLAKLKAQGTPIGLVSNSPLVFVERSLAIVGFESIFDVVISAHEVARPKPAPDPYLEACRLLGVEAGPSVVALEDSPTGVAAARAAGLTVIGVPSVAGVELLEAHHIAANLLDEVVLGLTLAV